jgi:replicative DNA polymerase I (EC 2.7.7.7)
VVGRANVDLYNIVEEFPEIKLKTLDRVAEYFGIMKRTERVLIPGHKIYEYWNDPKRIDVDYYVEKQIIPAALRIAEVVGVKEGDLKTGRAEKSLLDFL